MPPILYLIDGHALAYRTYYAITAGMSDRMQTRTGEPTAGIYGFANVLIRLLEQEKPEYLAVAFDTGKHSAMSCILNTKPHARRCRTTCDLRSKGSAR